MVYIGVSLVKLLYCTCRNGPYLMLLIIGNVILNLTVHKGRKAHLYGTNEKPRAASPFGGHLDVIIMTVLAIFAVGNVQLIS